MKIVVENMSTVFTIMLLFILISCTETHSEVLQLTRSIKMNSCSIDHIRLQTDSVWSSALEEVDKLLPANIHPKERETIVNLKSAHLLRNVDSYEVLGDQVYEIIGRMEVYDHQMADSIRGLYFQNQEMEMKLENALSKLKSQDLVAQLRADISDINADNCFRNR